MAEQQYWAYRVVPGMENEVEQRAAMEEGRRHEALRLAVQWIQWDDANEGILARAKLFETYLRGQGE